MRILHWTDHWRPLIGGIEVLISHLSQEQSRRGHTVAVLTERVVDTLLPYEAENNVAIHRLPLSRALNSKATREIAAVIRDLKNLITTFKPDVVHLHSTNPSIWLHRLAGTSRTTPTVATVHTPLSHYGIPRPMLDELWREVVWITCVSQGTRAELNAASPATASKTSVVLNGMPDVSVTASVPPPLHPVILCLGRLVPEKGFDVAIRAFVDWRRIQPSATLLIAGDGPARDDLESLANALLPPASFRFLGAVPPPDVPALISTVSFVVMPSLWNEPFGLVAVQAGQASRPVIASAIGGLPEVVKENETGLLFPPGDQAALTVAGEKLLRDPERSSRLGRAAQVHVAGKFSIEMCAANYDLIYAKIGRT